MLSLVYFGLFKMKKYINGYLMFTLAIPAVSLAALPDSEKEYICNQISYDNPLIMRPTAYSGERLFETESVNYVEVGKPLRVKAEQFHMLVWKNDLIPEYVTTRDFSFYRVDGKWSAPQVVREMDANESADIIFPIRGENRVAVFVKDEEMRAPGGPLGEEWYIPLCDVIEVVSHRKPTGEFISTAGGNRIDISIDANIDPLSERAQQGHRPLLTYKLRSALNGSISYEFTTTNTNVSYWPEYNGKYHISVIIDDGNLSSEINTGYDYYDQVDFTGGIPVGSIEPW